MMPKAEAAIREAADYLSAIEQMAEVYSGKIESLSGLEEDDGLFSHLRVLVEDRYGPAGHMAIGLIMMGLTSLCYAQGKIDEDEFQDIRADLQELVSEFLELTEADHGALH